MAGALADRLAGVEALQDMGGGRLGMPGPLSPISTSTWAPSRAVRTVSSPRPSMPSMPSMASMALSTRLVQWPGWTRGRWYWSTPGPRRAGERGRPTHTKCHSELRGIAEHRLNSTMSRQPVTLDSELLSTVPRLAWPKSPAAEDANPCWRLHPLMEEHAMGSAGAYDTSR